MRQMLHQWAGEEKEVKSGYCLRMQVAQNDPRRSRVKASIAMRSYSRLVAHRWEALLQWLKHTKELIYKRESSAAPPSSAWAETWCYKISPTGHILRNRSSNFQNWDFHHSSLKQWIPMTGTTFHYQWLELWTHSNVHLYTPKSYIYILAKKTRTKPII